VGYAPESVNSHLAVSAIAFKTANPNHQTFVPELTCIDILPALGGGVVVEGGEVVVEGGEVVVVVVVLGRVVAWLIGGAGVVVEGVEVGVIGGVVVLPTERPNNLANPASAPVNAAL